MRFGHVSAVPRVTLYQNDVAGTLLGVEIFHFACANHLPDNGIDGGAAALEVSDVGLELSAGFVAKNGNDDIAGIGLADFGQSVGASGEGA